MKTVLLVQTTIADYRDNFLSGCFYFASENGVKLKVLVGEEYFEKTTRTSPYVLAQPGVLLLKNLFMKRKLLLQLLPWRSILSADVVVCELNPRILNTWLTLALRGLLSRRTILWGHAWPRAGQGSRTDKLRGLMRAMASGLLLYTHSQKKELSDIHPRLPMYVAPNSLYYRKDIRSVYNPTSKSIIYVGRLIGSKKVSLLLSAFSLCADRIPEVILEFVGNGDEKHALEERAIELGIQDRVVFHGHVSCRNQLELIYRRAFVSVSPGYVGLSVTQSFSFGVPMIVSQDEKHSPEIEALLPGVNGQFFHTDDPDSLAGVIEEFFLNRTAWSERSNDIVNHCRENYSIERMVEGFYDSVFSRRS